MLWYKHGDISKLRNVSAQNICCLDVETTGLNPRTDEILQLAIIDGTGAVLINRYFKPIRHKVWPRAELVHGITPASVATLLPFAQERKNIQGILANMQILVGYNLSFDLSFLAAAGVQIPNVFQFDVMREFAPVLQRRSGNRRYRWWSLSVCAQYYDVIYRPHDALEDTRATLACFQRMLTDDGSIQRRRGSIPYLRIVEKYHG